MLYFIVMPNTEGDRCCISQPPILYLNVPLSLAIYPANAYPSNVFIKGPYGKHMGNHLWLTCHLLMMLYEVFLFLVCLRFFVLVWFFFAFPWNSAPLPWASWYRCLAAEEVKKRRLVRVKLQLGEEASAADEIPEKALASVKVPLMI